MLSLYLLADEAPTPRPSDLSRLTPVGTLPEESFRLLQAQRLLESRLEYAAGFRWSSSQAAAKLQLLARQFPELRPTTSSNATPEQDLFLALLAAQAQQMGLLATTG
ncbi:hypothetical protein LGH70_14735 [Hymenobacter sp. BT635]|uniref:Uncharacterized protein n=1 Tax=Hymenobacter nitidus TaxID=2880929 RepID=A0ABS8AEM3_9BACT|nr:hypothetical protein [Hymenobacter nitidus]MCB2378855.1 hypothetical protein [Hymenobacter nitidus]